MLIILLVFLCAWAIFTAPVYPYTRAWGFTPVSIPLILLVILLVLYFGGYIR